MNIENNKIIMIKDYEHIVKDQTGIIKNITMALPFLEDTGVYCDNKSELGYCIELDLHNSTENHDCSHSCPKDQGYWIPKRFFKIIYESNWLNRF